MTPTQTAVGQPLQTTTSTLNGTFSVNVPVARFLVVNGVGVVDCAQPQSVCGFGVSNRDTQTFGTVGMTFTTQPPVADPFNASITGTVTNTSGHPVAGTLVWAYQAGDTWVGSQRTTTDASGHYVLENAEPGIPYRIVFAPPAGSGLVTAWYSGQGSPGTPARATGLDVLLSAAQPVVPADARPRVSPEPVRSPARSSDRTARRPRTWSCGRSARRHIGRDVHDRDTRRRDVCARRPAAGHPATTLLPARHQSGLAPSNSTTNRTAATVIVASAGVTVHTNAQLAPSP